MSDDRITKLPKWAQDRFATLTRKAHRAEQKLSEYMDDQTPSKVWHENFTSGSKQFVQTEKITIEHADVVLDVTLFEDEPIKLSWRPSGGGFASVTSVLSLQPTNKHV
jgi:hypothetical protein